MNQETGVDEPKIVHKLEMNFKENMHRDGEMSHSPDFKSNFELQEIVSNKNKAIQDEYNTKALSKNAKTYELEKFEKNAMIIFNFENIEGYEERIGTNFDVASLADTFSKFGFEIELCSDLTKVELFTKLRTFSEKNFTDYGCIAIAILTHGTDYGLLRARDGQLFSEQDIVNHFKVHSKPTLYTKPIVLMIQACRGYSSTRGIMTMQRAKISRDHDQEMESYYLPVETDMLIFHSSIAGKPSFRPDNGSWFIQTLCKQIKKLYRKHHLESIFHEVKREVALEKYYMVHNPSTGEMKVDKQMPVVTSTLIRKLYLRSFEDSPPTRISMNNETSTDGQDSVAILTGSMQMDPCCCYLDHFDYMKRCLSHLVKSNPKKDKVAKYLLHMAEMQSGICDEKTKTTLAAISNYLQTHYEKSDYYNYIYFYEGDCELDDDIDLKVDQYKEYSLKQRIAKNWSEWCRSNTALTIGMCLGVFVMYLSFSKRLN